MMKSYLFSHRTRRLALVFVPGAPLATCFYCCFSVIIAPSDTSGAFYGLLFLVAIFAILTVHFFGNRYGIDPFVGRRMTYYMSGIAVVFMASFFLRWDFFWYWGTVATLFISVLALIVYELAALVKWFHIHGIVSSRRADRRYRRI